MISLSLAQTHEMAKGPSKGQRLVPYQNYGKNKRIKVTYVFEGG